MSDKYTAKAREVVVGCGGWIPPHPQALENLTRDIAAALREAAGGERERCAKVADEYADVNREMAGDTILLDPCLSGEGFTRVNVARSESLMVDGCVHSSKAHAATELARLIRALPDAPEEG